ncbi:MAG: hypothetical protein ACYC8T_01800 [Myxococcaceae bacterium]
MRIHLLLSLLGGLLLAACGSPVCDKNENLDWGAKQGDCGGSASPVLGARSACSEDLGACSGGDNNTLQSLLDCLSKLPVCASAEAASWSASRQACFDGAGGLSESCKSAFFEGGFPGQDAGVDAGEPDAGRQPITDGGGALNLVVVADETDFALAWTSSQKGQVSQWEVHSANAAGLKYPEASVPGGSWTLNDPDAGQGVKKTFFVAGLNAAGEVVMGQLAVTDAGASDAGCAGPLDCVPQKVCNLGACAEQSCQTSNTCPGGYLCETVAQRCERIFGVDSGVPDAGGPSDAGSERPMPFVSDLVTATTAAPGFSPEIYVSPFIGRNPAMVAIDSARQYVALEQESQLYGHLSIKRGADYPLAGLRRPSQIDSIGTHVKLAYNAGSGTLYACYNVGTAVRVRRSRDLGHTWGGPTEAVDIANDIPTDGGVAPIIQDCDIAPWRDGKAMLVMVDDSNLVVRTVNDSLSLDPPEVAFMSSGADGGINIFNPQRPVIATLPGDFAVHVGFTATRALPPPSSGMDTEVYALYRDQTTTVFTPAVRINETGVGTGNPFPQDHVALATDPVTKRAVAAFTSLESQGAANYNVIYVSIFDKATKRWGTGSDLSLFHQNVTKTEYMVIPARPSNSTWDAFSPTFAVTPSGKMFLSFLAGDQLVGAGPDYHAYVVPFSFSATSPVGAKGWYLPPAKKLGATKVVDPAGSGSAALPTRTASAADSQLSVYTVYIEAMGPAGDEANRAIMVTRP